MEGVDSVSPSPVQPQFDAQPPPQTESLGEHSLVKGGSSGDEVSGLQQRLQQSGYEVGQQGKFDSKTEAAVRQYQKDNNLKVDGKVGQQTWGNLLGQKGLPPGTSMLRGGTGAGAARTNPNPDPTGRFKDSFEPAGQQRPGARALPQQKPEQKPAGAQQPAPAKQPSPAQGPNAAGAAAPNGTAQRIVDEARKHIGYREGAGNANKFSTAMGRPAEKWCADFVSYVSKQAGANTVNSAAAQGIADQLQKQGRWKGRSNPQPGDAVTFNWSGSGGRANHVGLVESVFQKNGQTYIRTIEGNSADMVRRREYPVSSRVINGFGRIA